MDFQIKARQDFIFFGRNTLESLFASSKAFEWEWFVEDGNMVFEDQTCLVLHSDKNMPSLDRVWDFLSYLSGGATLTRCFTESSTVPVVGCSTKKSRKGDIGSDALQRDQAGQKTYPIREDAQGAEEVFFKEISADDTLSYWEEKAIQAGGAVTKPLLPAYICRSEKSFKENARNQEVSLFVFDTDYLNLQTIESLIRKLPENIMKGLYGAFTPENCSEFSNSHFQILWPKLLQGYFPRVQMKVEKSRAVNTYQLKRDSYL